jgi:hypothetical protein
MPAGPHIGSRIVLSQSQNEPSAENNPLIPIIPLGDFLPLSCCCNSSTKMAEEQVFRHHIPSEKTTGSQSP